MIRYKGHELNDKQLSENDNGVTPLKMQLIFNERPVGKLVKCKDYFGDVIWSMYNGQGFEIYRYAFNQDATNKITFENFSGPLKMFFTIVKETTPYSEQIPITEAQFLHTKQCMDVFLKQILKDENAELTMYPEEGGFSVEWPEKIYKYKSYIWSLALYWIRATFDIPIDKVESSIEDILQHFSEKWKEVEKLSLPSINAKFFTMSTLSYAPKIFKRLREDGLKITIEEDNPTENYSKYTKYDIHNEHGILSCKHL